MGRIYREPEKTTAWLHEAQKLIWRESEGRGLMRVEGKIRLMVAFDEDHHPVGRQESVAQ